LSKEKVEKAFIGSAEDEDEGEGEKHESKE